MHAGSTAYLSSFCLAVHAAAAGGGVVLSLSRFLPALLALLVIMHGDLVASVGGILLSFHGGDLFLVCLVSEDVVDGVGVLSSLLGGDFLIL